MTTQNDKPIHHFESPPVTEVVCGVQFKHLNSLVVAQFGQLWERFKVDGYTQSQDQGPLLPVIERFAGPPVEPKFSGDTLLPRVWFLHESRKGIIQVQRDRFLHNWKKAEPTDTYPHYQEVRSKFFECFSTFNQFLSENQLGQVEPNQYELTYVNHIPYYEELKGLRHLGRVFPDFRWRADTDRFLPEPTACNLALQFDLPDQAGRLHVATRSAIRNSDKMPLVLLELTVRGMAQDVSLEAMKSWFDLAREWIVKGFADLTDEQVQVSLWGKA
jgi:uncharacterized protein (TIGR04255 family)